MAARRVFVIWTHPILHESVRRLLDHPDIECVGATSDHAAARHEIARLRPDTIVVEEEERGQPMEALGLLEVADWPVRIFGLSPENNLLSIYFRKQTTMEQAGDLLRLIESE